jgi:regulatory protein
MMRKSKTASISEYRFKSDEPAIITAITYQKRDKLRASVFVAEKFAFGINIVTIERFRLRKKDELSHQLLEELKAFDERISAKRIASKFLNTRRRTEREVRDKLRTEKFEPELIDEIIPDLKNSGLINDEEFAAAFIHDKRIAKPISSRQLENELRKKGVSKSIIENSLIGADEEESDEDRAMKAATKKWEQLQRRESDDRKRKQKLITFLGSRGFGYDVIKNVIRVIAEDIQEEYD